MASSGAVTKLEAVVLADHSVTVANQRIYFASYLAEYRGDTPATYAQFLAVIDKYLRLIA